MSRRASRKSLEPTKSAKPSKARAGTRAPKRTKPADACWHCSKRLGTSERALFVEEEVGRVFCSEECITAFFSPEVQRLEREFVRRLSTSDLSGEERENLAYLRFITLQNPDEVWKEKTLKGDFRYTLIAEFEPTAKKVWCISICLFLKDEPSFLFMAFSTRNAAMVDAYRKGEQIEWESTQPKKNTSVVLKDLETQKFTLQNTDRLADSWTEDETFLAQTNFERDTDDIPLDEFDHYKNCLEETLQEPDEVWAVEMKKPKGLHLYHFIRNYHDGDKPHWYVILARETEEDEQIEILDAFPTRDAALVDRYRRGYQEVGQTTEHRPVDRIVH